MYKAPGQSISVWLEHLRNNPGSFTTTAAKTFDDWALQAGHYQISPARVTQGQTLQHDDTAYAAPSAQEGWAQQTILTHPSPAQVAAGRPIRNGSFETGSLT